MLALVWVKSFREKEREVTATCDCEYTWKRLRDSELCVWERSDSSLNLSMLWKRGIYYSVDVCEPTPVPVLTLFCYVFVTGVQCDQIGRLCKALGYKFCYKNTANIGQLSGLLWKASFLGKNCCGAILGNFWKIWLFIPRSGHTAEVILRDFGICLFSWKYHKTYHRILKNSYQGFTDSLIIENRYYNYLLGIKDTYYNTSTCA